MNTAAEIIAQKYSMDQHTAEKFLKFMRQNRWNVNVYDGQPCIDTHVRQMRVDINDNDIASLLEDFKSL